jgi:hypothetical protein
MFCGSRSSAVATTLLLLGGGCSALAPQEHDLTPVNPTAVQETHTSSAGSQGLPTIESTTLSYTRAAMQRTESSVRGTGIFARPLYGVADLRIERLDRNLTWLLDAKTKKAIECPLKGCSSSNPKKRLAREDRVRGAACRLKIAESAVVATATGGKRHINGFDSDQYDVTWQVTLRDNASRKSVSTVRMEMWMTPIAPELKDAIALEKTFKRTRDRLSGQSGSDTTGLLPPEAATMISEHLASSISPTDRANLMASVDRAAHIKGQAILTSLEWRIAGEACSPGAAAKDREEPLLKFSAEVKTYRIASLHDSLFMPPKEYRITK